MPETRDERRKYIKTFTILFFAIAVIVFVLIIFTQKEVISIEMVLDIIFRSFLIAVLLTSMIHGLYFHAKWVNAKDHSVNGFLKFFWGISWTYGTIMFFPYYFYNVYRIHKKE